MERKSVFGVFFLVFLLSLKIRRGLNFTVGWFRTSIPFHPWKFLVLYALPLYHEMYEMVVFGVPLRCCDGSTYYYELEREQKWHQGIDSEVLEALEFSFMDVF